MKADDRRPVVTLGLPSRAVHGLHNDGIRTLGDLRQHPEAWLRRIPNIGYKTLRQIAEAVEAVDRGEVPPKCDGPAPHGKNSRNEEIYRRMTAGESAETVGASLGISRGRARQLFDQQSYRARLEHQRVHWEPPADGS